MATTTTSSNTTINNGGIGIGGGGFVDSNSNDNSSIGGGITDPAPAASANLQGVLLVDITRLFIVKFLDAPDILNLIQTSKTCNNGFDVEGDNLGLWTLLNDREIMLTKLDHADDDVDISSFRKNRCCPKLNPPILNPQKYPASGGDYDIVSAVTDPKLFVATAGTGSTPEKQLKTNFLFRSYHRLVVRDYIKRVPLHLSLLTKKQQQQQQRTGATTRKNLASFQNNVVSTLGGLAREQLTISKTLLRYVPIISSAENNTNEWKNFLVCSQILAKTIFSICRQTNGKIVSFLSPPPSPLTTTLQQQTSEELLSDQRLRDDIVDIVDVLATSMDNIWNIIDSLNQLIEELPNLLFKKIIIQMPNLSPEKKETIIKRFPIINWKDFDKDEDPIELSHSDYNMIISTLNCWFEEIIRVLQLSLCPPEFPPETISTLEYSAKMLLSKILLQQEELDDYYNYKVSDDESPSSETEQEDQQDEVSSSSSESSSSSDDDDDDDDDDNQIGVDEEEEDQQDSIMEIRTKLRKTIRGIETTYESVNQAFLSFRRLGFVVDYISITTSEEEEDEGEE